jgi:hypothetical protein
MSNASAVQELQDIRIRLYEAIAANESDDSGAALCLGTLRYRR